MAHESDTVTVAYVPPDVAVGDAVRLHKPLLCARAQLMSANHDSDFNRGRVSVDDAHRIVGVAEYGGMTTLILEGYEEWHFEARYFVPVA